MYVSCCQECDGGASDRSCGHTDPVNLDSIRAIGQWAFLTVEMDEVVDTVDRGLFSSDRISVAYHGTLHYGIDVAEARPGWVTIAGDTAVSVVLPPVKLLDDRFLDERNVKRLRGTRRYGLH